jgi:hypothetical protein
MCVDVGYLEERGEGEGLGLGAKVAVIHGIPEGQDPLKKALELDAALDLVDRRVGRAERGVDVLDQRRELGLEGRRQ